MTVTVNSVGLPGPVMWEAAAASMPSATLISAVHEAPLSRGRQAWYTAVESSRPRKKARAPAGFNRGFKRVVSGRQSAKRRSPGTLGFLSLKCWPICEGVLLNRHGL